MYTQCELNRGSESMVAFVPSGFARKGQYVRLRDDDYAWQVVGTGATVTAKELHRKTTADRSQRDASDI